LTTIPTFRLFGEHTLLLEWPLKIDMEIHEAVLSYSNHIRGKYEEWLVDVVPTYCSIALFLKPSVGLSEVVARIKNDLADVSEEKKSPRHLISLPVCYDENFGLDLLKMAEAKNLDIQHLIKLHTAPIYTVYFIGFLPGFPYMGGLNPLLAMDRKRKPRPSIPKGSVAIGGSQTGIYPRESPGGWNIIGRTPLDLFDPEARIPTMIKAGDRIRFEAVTLEEYELIGVELEAGTFVWRKEEIHD